MEQLTPTTIDQLDGGSFLRLLIWHILYNRQISGGEHCEK